MYCSVSKGGSTLFLSSGNLSSKASEALSKVILSLPASSFLELDISDSVLSQQSIKTLLNGISSSEAVRVLNLKGNSLDASSVAALALFVKNSSTLLKLSLEWCNLGLSSDSFATLCDAIRLNASLTTVDLRHNCIGQVGAKSLASAVKSNTTLRSIDLRWNKLSLRGASDLLEALKSSRGLLLALELEGNDVPAEIGAAIKRTLAHNAERQAVIKEVAERSKAIDEQMEATRKKFVARESVLQRNLAALKSDREIVVEASTAEIERLKEEISRRDDELGSVREDLDFVRRALYVAETSLKEALERDADREKHVKEDKRRREESLLDIKQV